MQFKDSLLYFRTKAHLTQQELADKACIAKMTVCAYELGSKRPSIETLVLLAKALDCTTDELLGVTESAKV